jgi:hypothetical protein
MCARLETAQASNLLRREPAFANLTKEKVCAQDPPFCEQLPIKSKAMTL